MSAFDGHDVRTLAVTWRDGHRATRHAHGWAQLLYARSGLMHVLAGDRLWVVPPTRAIWIPPGVAHEIDVRGDVALRTLYIARARAARAERAEGARGDLMALGVAALEVNALLRELILHVVDEGMLDPRRPEHDRLAGVLMDRIDAAPAIDLVLPMPRDARARRLADRLRGEPAAKTDLERLAGDSGASLRTLQRCFADETGMTIDAWRQKARLVHAAALLATGARVSSAAQGSGYDSPSAFIAAFRRQFGTTPGRFAREA